MLTIRVRLTNRLARLESVDSDVRKWLQTFFRFRTKGYWFTSQYQSGGWDGYKSLYVRDCISSGLFLERRQVIEDTKKVRFDVTDQRRYPAFHDLPVHISKKLWEFQLECVQTMREHANVGGIILNATGTGKTYLAGAYLSGTSGQALFVVDELGLLEQSREAISTLLQEPVGVIGKSKLEPERVSVATIQTLHRHRKSPEYVEWVKGIETLFVDEIHTALNRRNVQTIAALQPLSVFGLTATLQLRKTDVRARAVALSAKPIFTYPISKATKEKHLSPGIVCAVNWFYKGAADDYASAYDQQIVRSKSRNDLITGLIVEAFNRGHYIVAIVERVLHLSILHERLEREGIAHETIFGDVKGSDRRDATRRMDREELRVILANKVFSKGIDIHAVDVTIDATAFRNCDNAIQRFGRGVRLHEGKVGLIHFDIGDMTPPGYLQRSLEGNRFATCTRSRRRAFRSSDIPLFTVDARIGIKAVFDQAEAFLSRYTSETPAKPG